MTSTEMIWLRSQAAQRNALHIMSYSTAFFGTAALQALHLGVTAPRSYWAALSRAAATPPKAASRAKARAKTADVVALTAPPAAQNVAMVAAPQDEPLAQVSPSPHLLDAPRGGVADDLTAIRGVGAKLAEALNEFGIYHYDQIATLDDEGIAWLDAQQKGFRMICARHDIVAQARAMI